MGSRNHSSGFYTSPFPVFSLTLPLLLLLLLLAGGEPEGAEGGVRRGEAAAAAIVFVIVILISLLCSYMLPLLEIIPIYDLYQSYRLQHIPRQILSI
jgi:hypothetical protein